MAQAAFTVSNVPQISAFQGVALTDQTVATFTAGNPLAPMGDYTATVSWGDGSPTSNATISPLGGNSYAIKASHTFSQTNTFTITTMVYDEGILKGAVNDSVTVPLILQGQLNPSSDSGESNSDGITNVNRPDFYGTSDPGSIIQLYAVPTGGSTPVSIGTTTTETSGAWNITSSVLADGSYTILARATDGGTTTTTQILPNPNGGPLVIDTAGPQVMGVSFNRRSAKVTVEFKMRSRG